MAQKTGKKTYGPPDTGDGSTNSGARDDSMGGFSSRGRTPDFSGGMQGRGIGGSGISVGGVGTGVAGPLPGDRVMGRGYGVRGSFSFKEGGKVKKMAKGGSTASKRADGCATKGKTKGRFVW